MNATEANEIDKILTLVTEKALNRVTEQGVEIDAAVDDVFETMGPPVSEFVARLSDEDQESVRGLAVVLVEMMHAAA